MPESSTITPPRAESVTGELTLRLCGTPHDGRLVKLRAAKCTIGSAPHCTLCLRAPGVAAVHCLIVRGPERTFVRSWSDKTWLNGSPVSESTLSTGDRLTLGTVEFEVLGAVSRVPPPVPACTTSVISNHAGPDTQIAKADDGPLDEERRIAARHGRARVRRLVARLREMQHENELHRLRLAIVDESPKQVAAGGESDDLRAQLQNLADEEQRLCHEREQVQREQQSLRQCEETLRANRERLAEERRQLSTDEQRIAQEREALSVERQQWLAIRAEHEASLQAASEELARLDIARADFDALRLALDEQERSLWTSRSALDAELAESERFRSHLAESQGAVEQERGRLEALAASLAEQQQTLERDRASLNDQAARVDEARGQREAAEQERGRLETLAASLAEQQQTLERDRASLNEQAARVDEARGQLEAAEQERGRLEALAASLTEQQQTLERDRASLNEQAARMDEARGQLEAAEQERGRLESLAASLTEQQQALERERIALDEQAARLEDTRSQLEQDQAAIDSQQALLRQELKTFEEHKHFLAVERLDWRTETSRAEAEMAARREDLERREAALERHQAEQDLARRRLEESQKGFTRRQEILQQAEDDVLERKRELQERQLSLEDERCTLEQDRAILAAERESLATQQAAIAAERQNQNDVRQQDSASQDEWTSRLNEQTRDLHQAIERLNQATQELDRRQTLLDAVRQELEDERCRWETERAQWRSYVDAQREEYERELAALRGGLNVEPTPFPPAVDFENRPAHEASANAEVDNVASVDCVTQDETVGVDGDGGSVDDVSPADSLNDSVEHIQFGSDNAEQNEAPGFGLDTHFAESGPAQADSQFQVPSQPHSGFDRVTEERSASLDAAEEAAPLAAESSSTESAHSDDESIDDYMSRLLKRVSSMGRPSVSAASEASHAPATEPQTEARESAAPHTSTEPPRVPELPLKLVPRATAPELSSNLAAMRELANMTARAAIDKHAYRNWGRAAFGKLAIATLAAGTGVGALSFATAPDSMLMYAAVASFVVTLFWLLQAGILVKNVIRASRRNAAFAKQALPGVVPAEQLAVSAAEDGVELPSAEIIAPYDGEQTAAQPSL